MARACAAPAPPTRCFSVQGESSRSAWALQTTTQQRLPGAGNSWKMRDRQGLVISDMHLGERSAVFAISWCTTIWARSIPLQWLRLWKSILGGWLRQQPPCCAIPDRFARIGKLWQPCCTFVELLRQRRPWGVPPTVDRDLEVLHTRPKLESDPNSPITTTQAGEPDASRCRVNPSFSPMSHSENVSRRLTV